MAAWSIQVRGVVRRTYRAKKSLSSHLNQVQDWIFLPGPVTGCGPPGQPQILRSAVSKRALQVLEESGWFSWFPVIASGCAQAQAENDQ